MVFWIFLLCLFFINIIRLSIYFSISIKKQNAIGLQSCSIDFNVILDNKNMVWNNIEWYFSGSRQFNTCYYVSCKMNIIF